MDDQTIVFIKLVNGDEFVFSAGGGEHEGELLASSLVMEDMNLRTIQFNDLDDDFQMLNEVMIKLTNFE